MPVPPVPRRRYTDSLSGIVARVEAIERRDIEADLLHRELKMNDGETAKAIKELTDTLNHPKTGLIVELDRFRAEVIADRQQFRAWIRGATAVLASVFTLITVAAPWIRDLISAIFAVKQP
jgi:hypothetical protein